MDKECSFSVELSSRDSLKGLMLNGNRGKGLMMDGSLGELEEIEFHEDSVLIITGTKGVARLDIQRDTLFKMLKREG